MKKITLKKETIRKLDERALDQVNGGATTTISCLTWFCTRNCLPCDTSDYVKTSYC